jgi:glycerophosphoryl diester phosphodiesterase
MIRRYFTIPELVDIYKLHQEGKTIPVIADKVGTSYIRIKNLIDSMDRYLTRFNSIKARNKNYMKAREIILSERIIKPTEFKPAVLVIEKNSTFQEQAERLQQNLDNAIQNMVIFFVEQKNKELLEENKQLKEQVETWKPIVEKAKHNNAVVNIGRHFGMNI